MFVKLKCGTFRKRNLLRETFCFIICFLIPKYWKSTRKTEE